MADSLNILNYSSPRDERRHWSFLLIISIASVLGIAVGWLAYKPSVWFVSSGTQVVFTNTSDLFLSRVKYAMVFGVTGILIALIARLACDKSDRRFWMTALKLTLILLVTSVGHLLIIRQSLIPPAALQIRNLNLHDTHFAAMWPRLLYTPLIGSIVIAIVSILGFGIRLLIRR